MVGLLGGFMHLTKAQLSQPWGTKTHCSPSLQINPLHEGFAPVSSHTLQRLMKDRMTFSSSLRALPVMVAVGANR